MSRRHREDSARSSPPSSPKGSPKPSKLKGSMPEIWLGRPGRFIGISIIGLPNAGKSSLFNTLTQSNVPADNYPMRTTTTTEARSVVVDDRFQELCDLYQPQMRTPAYLVVHDTAGLIRGAHEGKGLGNEFLSHIRATDAAFHMIRAFDDDSVVHIDDTIDPIRDLETITGELMEKDKDVCTEERAKVMKQAGRGGHGAAAARVHDELVILDKCLAGLEEGKQIRFLEWHSMDTSYLNSLYLMTAKPQVFLINLSRRDFCRKKNKWLGKIKVWVDEHCPGEPIIPMSVEYEQAVANGDGDPQCPSAVPKLVRAGFASLHLINFYTKEGTKECKSWTIRRGTTALEAANVVHSDFHDYFVSATVFSFDDLKELGSEAQIHSAGKLRNEGKNYVVKDGDIIHFKAGKARSSRGKSH